MITCNYEILILFWGRWRRSHPNMRYWNVHDTEVTCCTYFVCIMGRNSHKEQQRKESLCSHSFLYFQKVSYSILYFCKDANFMWLHPSFNLTSIVLFKQSVLNNVRKKCVVLKWYEKQEKVIYAKNYDSSLTRWKLRKLHICWNLISECYHVWIFLCID